MVSIASKNKQHLLVSRGMQWTVLHSPCLSHFSVFPFSDLFTRCRVKCVTKLAGVYTKTLKAPLQGVPCSLTESQLLSAFNYDLQVVFRNILLSMLSVSTVFVSARLSLGSPHAAVRRTKGGCGSTAHLAFLLYSHLSCPRPHLWLLRGKN